MSKGKKGVSSVGSNKIKPSQKEKKKRMAQKESMETEGFANPRNFNGRGTHKEKRATDLCSKNREKKNRVSEGGTGTKQSRLQQQFGEVYRPCGREAIRLVGETCR